jgi:hypothetical protein
VLLLLVVLMVHCCLLHAPQRLQLTPATASQCIAETLHCC